MTNARCLLICLLVRGEEKLFVGLYILVLGLGLYTANKLSLSPDKTCNSILEIIHIAYW